MLVGVIGGTGPPLLRRARSSRASVTILSIREGRPLRAARSRSGHALEKSPRLPPEVFAIIPSRNACTFRASRNQKRLVYRHGLPVMFHAPAEVFRRRPSG